MKEERKFECPKCTSSNVSIDYAPYWKKLECFCIRCKYSWQEDPSDKKPEQEQKGPLYDPLFG